MENERAAEITIGGKAYELVLTTGATVNAASRALLRAGASAVDVLTFARVVTDGRGLTT